MAYLRAVLAACLLALLQVATAGKCDGMSYLKGADHSPTGGNIGKCTNKLESGPKSSSHWCKGPGLRSWPDGPNPKAKQCMKFGRMTAYRGPIGGSSPAHKAACNKMLAGSNERALVAVSTKYLKTYQGGWTANKGACNMCMCIRIHGGDMGSNPGLQKDAAGSKLGLSFMGQVGDRCAECEDDHIDILQDRPFTWAPYSPAQDKVDQWAPWANAKEGFRGFDNPQFIRGAKGSPESIGIWTADWQWAPCSMTHGQCANMMQKMGYAKSFPPKYVGGMDSFTMRPLAGARVARNSRLFKAPWGNQG